MKLLGGGVIPPYIRAQTVKFKISLFTINVGNKYVARQTQT